MRHFKIQHNLVYKTLDQRTDFYNLISKKAIVISGQLNSIFRNAIFPYLYKRRSLSDFSELEKAAARFLIRKKVLEFLSNPHD